MAEFKLGVAGSEYDLPTGVAEELPSEQTDRFLQAEVSDGSFRYCSKPKVRRSWALSFEKITATDCDTLDTIDGLGGTLNYINGYQGLAAGVNVIVLNYSGRKLITESSGLTTIQYNASMTLLEVV